MNLLNISDTFEREIEQKPLNNVVFNIGLGGILILVTFFIGIRPTSLALTQNLKYKKELKDIKTAMQYKLTQVSEMQNSLVGVYDKVEILNNAIADDENFETYIQELVNSAASSGFIVLQVKKDNLTVDFSGETSRIPTLVKNLENLNRFTAIKELKIALDEENPNNSTIQVLLENYSL